MPDSSFQPGSLVRDNRSRVGRVVGDSEAIIVSGEPVDVLPVDFWGELQKRPVEFLSPLDGDSPEALLWERPRELQPWAENAPLRLIALALSVGGGCGKAADIRDKISGRVIGKEQWENWWKKHSRSLGSLPDCFQSVKAPKGNDYRLLTSVADVPADWTLPAKTKPVPVKVWREWLLSGAPEDVPGRYPTKPVIDALAKWDDGDTIEQVLTRLEVTAEGLMSKGEMAAQEAEGWLSAIGSAAIRRRAIGGPDPRGYDAARAGEVLARLAGIAGERTPQELLLQAGVLDGVADAWRRGFLAGLWESFEGEGARTMYLDASAVLGRQARVDLARQMFLAAFGPDFSERRHAELDRLLDALPESDRAPLLEEVMARASSAQRAEVRDYLASSRHAQGDGQLPLRIAAALLLSDGSGEFASRTSRELAGLIENPQGYGKTLEGVFSAAASKNVESKLTATAEVQKRSAEAQAEIEAERQEQERLRQQVRERNAELAANREESRLELRQDMLLVMAELLQAVPGWNSLDDAVRDVEAGIALALGAGGAELLESPGQWVEYDVRLHNAEEKVHPGARVRVVAPGVIYRGGMHGDRVLLKAQVKHEAG